MNNSTHGKGGTASGRIRLCVDCAHCNESAVGVKTCNAVNDIDLVSGEQSKLLCYFARLDGMSCGPAGVLWDGRK